MHKPSISILGPGPDVMLIEGFDCSMTTLKGAADHDYMAICDIS